MIKDYMRKDLRDFIPYHAPAKSYQIKIDANENPFNHHPNVVEKAKQWLNHKDHLTRYPDTDAVALRETIARYHQVAPEQVICGTGSDQLIEYVTKCFIEPGDVILAPDPSFSMYDLSNRLNHGKTIFYALNPDFSYNIETILELYATHQPKLVFVCSPNNPTGSVIEPELMKKLLETIKCPVILDEAYDEFVSASMLDAISAHPELLILRTFSKAYGLAGLRIGYGIGSFEMIEALNVCKAPYNVSAFSLAMAQFVLEENDYYMEQVHALTESRHDLFKALKATGLFETVYPSKANFILAKVMDDAKTLVTYLETVGILVRGYGTTGPLANCVRITIGTQGENAILLNHLKSF